VTELEWKLFNTVYFAAPFLLRLLKVSQYPLGLRENFPVVWQFSFAFETGNYEKCSENAQSPSITNSFH